jgi:hypothetical protein
MATVARFGELEPAATNSTTTSKAGGLKTAATTAMLVRPQSRRTAGRLCQENGAWRCSRR